jgi:hypothetical protein
MMLSLKICDSSQVKLFTINLSDHYVVRAQVEADLFLDLYVLFATAYARACCVFVCVCSMCACV